MIKSICIGAIVFAILLSIMLELVNFLITHDLLGYFFAFLAFLLAIPLFYLTGELIRDSV